MYTTVMGGDRAPSVVLVVKIEQRFCRVCIAEWGASTVHDGHAVSTVARGDDEPSSPEVPDTFTNVSRHVLFYSSHQPTTCRVLEKKQWGNEWEIAFN